jgi:hypothetical protein
MLQVDIEVVSVETHLAGQVYPGSREQILSLMHQKVHTVLYRYTYSSLGPTLITDSQAPPG